MNTYFSINALDPTLILITDAKNVITDAKNVITDAKNVITEFVQQLY